MEPTRLTELLKRHAGLIHKVAWAYCRDAADREDVVQEIAVQLWRAHHRYDPRFRESTWIARIALNVAISFQRRERRHKDKREPLEPHAIRLVAVTEERGDAAERLRAAIDALGPLDKALVLLHLEGEEHAAIAETLGISPGNVATKLWRIKERLRGTLTPAVDASKEERDGTR